jgi:hypothetical protein
MILPEAGFAVAQDDEGLFFHSPDVDLDEDSLVLPIDCGDGVGTIEFHRRYVMIHPPNGESRRLPVEEFIRMVEKRDP